MREGEKSLWGVGTPARKFLYVGGTAGSIRRDGLLLLGAERHDGGKPVNLWVGGEIAVHDLVPFIAAEVGFKGVIVWDTPKPNASLASAWICRRRIGFPALKPPTKCTKAFIKTMARFGHYDRQQHDVVTKVRAPWRSGPVKTFLQHFCGTMRPDESETLPRDSTRKRHNKIDLGHRTDVRHPNLMLCSLSRKGVV